MHLQKVLFFIILFILGLTQYGIIKTNFTLLLNCSTVKLWALTGQVLMEMAGHTSLVYSVAAHSSGLVASGSEDRFLKIWKGFFFFVILGSDRSQVCYLPGQN